MGLCYYALGWRKVPRLETKEKKIKKILTKEQYEKWQAEQNSARKKASQRRMHKDNHPDKGPDFEQKNL